MGIRRALTGNQVRAIHMDTRSSRAAGGPLLPERRTYSQGLDQNPAAPTTGEYLSATHSGGVDVIVITATAPVCGGKR